MTPIQIYVISILVMFLGAIISLFLSKKPQRCGYISLLIMIIASLGIFYVASHVFIYGPIETTQTLFKVIGLADYKEEAVCYSCHPTSKTLFTVPGFGASLTFRIDELSAVFLAIIIIVGLCATLYSLRYMDHYEKGDLVGYYPPLFLFIAGMVGVVGMWDFFFFFIFWEFMTLASYALVIFERDKKENLRAGFKYFLMTHIATALMFIAAIILYVHGHSFGFETMRKTLTDMLITNPYLVHMILAFFFIGFATKAGLFPFGDWLPDAHPAAPSGISALLSGVMIKMGAYGLLRVFVTILPASYHTTVWGGVIAFFGAVSLFIGSITALAQKDSKRLLAFSSIGQMGYICLALGMGIAFLRVNPAISTIAFIAGLFHIINDAFFKALLFLNAGSILYKAHTRDLNIVSGLSKWMPYTAFTVLIGVLSVAGIPPLNGFSSKWLIFNATILGGIDRPIYVFYGLAALFISAVTMAYAIKFMATSFFGELPVHLQSKKETDVPASMQVPQIILAILCILFGLFPAIPLKILYLAAGSSQTGIHVPAFESLFGETSLGLIANLGEGIGGLWNPVILFIAFAICFVIVYVLSKSGGAATRRSEVWYCGEAHKPAEVHFSADSLFAPFKRVFRIRIGGYRQEGIYPAWKVPTIPLPTELKKAFDVDQWFYYPIVRWSLKFFEQFAKTHVGIPQVYTLWMVMGTIFAIIIMFALSRVY